MSLFKFSITITDCFTAACLITRLRNWLVIKSASASARYRTGLTNSTRVNTVSGLISNTLLQLAWIQLRLYTLLHVPQPQPLNTLCTSGHCLTLGTPSVPVISRLMYVLCPRLLIQHGLRLTLRRPASSRSVHLGFISCSHRFHLVITSASTAASRLGSR